MVQLWGSPWPIPTPAEGHPQTPQSEALPLKTAEQSLSLKSWFKRNTGELASIQLGNLQQIKIEDVQIYMYVYIYIYICIYIYTYIYNIYMHKYKSYTYNIYIYYITCIHIYIHYKYTYIYIIIYNHMYTYNIMYLICIIFIGHNIYNMCVYI